MSAPRFTQRSGAGHDFFSRGYVVAAAGCAAARMGSAAAAAYLLRQANAAGRNRMNQQHVLVVEDNADIAQLLELHLATIPCKVKRVADGESALAEAKRAPYALVVLDLMLPGIDGLEVCRRLRGGEADIAILMLTARSSEVDRVLGLELGADDYLTKPFSVLEFVARVKALLRRAARAAHNADDAQQIRIGELVIDVARRDVRDGERQIELTAKEFDLLVHFARSPGRVMTRTQLLDQVWGYSHSGYEHTVNTHINRLRSKVERDPNRPELIQTVWGVGYRCRDPRERAAVC
jgi:DNA-binding response OmpR family regulator